MTTFPLPAPYQLCPDPTSNLHRTNRCACDWVRMLIDSERELAQGQPMSGDPWLAGVTG